MTGSGRYAALHLYTLSLAEFLDFRTRAVKDHWPKLVVTLDPFWRAEDQGVLGIHLKDFLLRREW
jgi:predicted AAA+ superfamily ATPase